MPKWQIGRCVMKVKDIIALTDASQVVECKNDFLDDEYNYGFASDLMSDCLMLIDDNHSGVVLVTGLASSSSFRTAEMLDISFVLLVRGKVPNAADIALAKKININVYMTNYTMFKVCGILSKNGLKPLD